MQNSPLPTDAPSAAFSLRGLTKSYDDFTLGPLDLELAPGTVLALVGPNGAGKTTTMNCLAGLLRPHAGQAWIFGRRVDPTVTSWKEDVGYVGEEQGFYEKYSAAENLRLITTDACDLKKTPRTPEMTPAGTRRVFGRPAVAARACGCGIAGHYPLRLQVCDRSATIRWRQTP